MAAVDAGGEMRFSVRGFFQLLARGKGDRKDEAGAGNYAYVCTRVKAKRASLLPKDAYPKLMGMEVAQISRFLGETTYRTEMQELALKYSGIDLAEMALTQNLARTSRDVLKLCKGELRAMVRQYLRRYDVWNVKTLLRGEVYDAPADQVLKTIVAAGVYDAQFWIDISVSAHGIDDALEQLKTTEFHSVLKEVRDRLEKADNAAPFEDALDKWYYGLVLGCRLSDTRANKLFFEFLRREIDIMNLKTLLKLKFDEVEPDKISSVMLDGGLELPTSRLTKLAAMESFDSVVSELANMEALGAVKGRLEAAAKSGSLSPVMRELDRYLINKSSTFSHLYPLSVIPVLDFLLRKKVEVDNVRVIVRGKDSGLPDETVRELLVV